MKNFTIGLMILVLMILVFIGVLLGGIGWIKCLGNLTKTDFNAPYKAEVIYGIGTLTGAGAIIGWIDIKD